MLGAAVVLVALGAVWLSVRGQHPYKGPTAAGLLVMYGILVLDRRGRQVQATRVYGIYSVTAQLIVLGTATRSPSLACRT